MNKKDVLIVISLFSIAFYIRANGVSYSALYIDEWIYMLKTRLILSNSWVPVPMVFDRSPPFYSHIGALVTVLFGGDLNTIRMTSVVFGSLNVAMIYLFGKAVYDRKTGLLAALFLLISPFHVLYSHIYMLETLTLFFIISFLYYFWLSKRSADKKSVTYAMMAGAMFGLAIDAKYISLFILPSIIGTVLWVNRFNFKDLFNKKIKLIFIFAFLFFLPLMLILFYTGVGFHGFAYFAYERFQGGTVSRNTVAAPYTYSLTDIIIKGQEKVTDVYAWGNDAYVIIPPWNTIVKISIILLLMITSIYYFLGFLKRDEKSSFFIISILMLIILIFVSGNTRHYWIYSFPFYYVMFSHLALESSELLKKRKDKKNIFSSIIILLTIMILIFYFVSTLTSPYWDRGDYHPWAKTVVDFIRSDIARNGYEENNVLIGNVMTINRMVGYELYLDKSNISTIALLTAGDEYSGEFATLDLKRIENTEPTYLLVPDTFYAIYFTDIVKEEIFKNYSIVLKSKDYPTGCIVLKRNNIQHSEFKIPEGPKEGEISKTIYMKTVPNVMDVGRVYKAVVEVKNTGNLTRSFTVRVQSNDFIIFVEDNQRGISLDKRSTQRLEFKIVPMEKYVGKLPITVNLYANYETNGRSTIKEVDSVTDYVYRIKI
jgi:4-amino-4-deoxy-L-arabinose transferase-like glycosyltransferase